ncbi:hypothetical protein LSO9J_60040 [Candidatus Liberibacter solanacearum]
MRIIEYSDLCSIKLKGLEKYENKRCMGGYRMTIYEGLRSIQVEICKKNLML